MYGYFCLQPLELRGAPICAYTIVSTIICVQIVIRSPCNDWIKKYRRRKPNTANMHNQGLSVLKVLTNLGERCEISSGLVPEVLDSHACPTVAGPGTWRYPWPVCSVGDVIVYVVIFSSCLHWFDKSLNVIHIHPRILRFVFARFDEWDRRSTKLVERRPP